LIQLENKLFILTKGKNNLHGESFALFRFYREVCLSISITFN